MTSYSGIMKLGHRWTCRLCEATVVGSVGGNGEAGAIALRKNWGGFCEGGGIERGKKSRPYCEGLLTLRTIEKKWGRIYVYCVNRVSAGEGLRALKHFCGS